MSVPERHLLVVSHSRTGSTQALRDVAVEAATAAADDEVTLRVLGAFEAGPDDVLWAHGVLLVTPANFGYMSGALKDFFERVYHPCLDRTAGVLQSVGLPTDFFPPTFAISRAAGWTAHVLEQVSDNRLIRPQSEYVGPEPKKPVALADRR